MIITFFVLRAHIFILFLDLKSIGKFCDYDMIQITEGTEKKQKFYQKEAFFMITFCAAMETPRQPETPEWMREERYMYCDQSAGDQYSVRNFKILERIKKIFS